MFEEVRKNATGALDRAKLVFNRGDSESVEEQSQPDRLDELSDLCPQLSFQQRLIGFAASFTLGYLIAFMSFRFFIRLIEGNPYPFALNYSFGHILQLSASTFLCGPKRQFKNMFDDKRRMTSIVYLGCLCLTLIVVFLPMGPLDDFKWILLIAFMLTQCAASVWYSLSYIPYGRRTAANCLKRQLGLDETNYAGVSTPNVLGGGP